MDRRRGIALVMALAVMLVVTVLSASFFSGAISDKNLISRYSDSTRAFWLAEAGIAEALSNMPNSVSGSIGDLNYQYSVPAPNRIGATDYYQITSTGSVNSALSPAITRTIATVVRTDPVDPLHFQHAIRTTSDLVIKGSVTINGPQEEHASLNFADLFEHSKEEIKSYADHHYTDPGNNIAPVNGITWVDLSPGQELQINSNTWSGSGVLIVAGNAQITGGTFNGIIYVIGTLRMSGNPVINGSILAESSTEIDTKLTGNVTINYNSGAITAALSPLGYVAPTVVSWSEN